MIIAQANHQLKNTDFRNKALANIEESQYQQAKLILQAQFMVDDRQPTSALQSIQQLQVKGARQFFSSKYCNARASISKRLA
jgi:HemY protein